jgi:hypothetical protein
MFDIVIHTQNGALFCVKFIRKLSNDTETTNLVTKEEEDDSKVAKKVLKVNIKHAHECIGVGYLTENMTCKTAAQLGMVLSRTAFSTCIACAIGKAKQHNISKETRERRQPYSMEEWAMTWLRSRLLRSFR